MRLRHAPGAALAALALLATTACGGGDEPAGDAPGGAADDAAEARTPGEGADLLAYVGTAEDPDAFEIAVVDASGERVETLPAGDYTIEVDDPSTIHNWHLTGGSVDETTTVDGTGTTMVEVTLEPGEYTYTCDPHPNMTGAFTVEDA
ncbi:cupredoxin domain-containing protein [Cellulomonas endophytica]|uniref:cupredoxin domain-containing protein n=1 Tax=Cellulomonas endophytica TaxID=2494735 RepID=UPI0010135047|nr:plastocyanin/azurin family copper-binding protein [Cellulomonas endophytica]